MGKRRTGLPHVATLCSAQLQRPGVEGILDEACHKAGLLLMRQMAEALEADKLAASNLVTRGQAIRRGHHLITRPQ
jgi:hypothetical protein